ncbi:MAG: hypothetical protein ACW98X_25710 [Promethearchaeota archaeon]
MNGRYTCHCLFQCEWGREWGRIFICENVEDYFTINQEIKQVSPLLVG